MFAFRCVKKQFMTLLEVLIGMVLAIILLSTLSYFYRQVEWMNSMADQTHKDNFQLRYVESRLAKIVPEIYSEREMKKHFYFYTVQNSETSSSPCLVFTFKNGVKLESPLANEAIGRLYLNDQSHQLCLAIWPSPKRWEELEKDVKIAKFPMSKEILLEGVQSVKFEFYVAPEKDRSRVLDQKKKTDPNKKEDDKKKSDKQGKPEVNQSGKQQDQKQTPQVKKEAEEQMEELNPDSDVGHPMPKGPWSPEWKHEYAHLPAAIKIHVTRKKKDGEEEEVTFAFPLPNSQKIIVYGR